MSLIVQALPKLKLVSEGVYTARLESIESIETINGDAYKFIFIITSDCEFKDRKINGVCGIFLYPDSKFYKWVTAIRIAAPRTDENVDLSQLIGMECEITVTHAERGGRLFANVSDVSVFDGNASF